MCCRWMLPTSAAQQQLLISSEPRTRARNLSCRASMRCLHALPSVPYMPASSTYSIRQTASARGRMGLGTTGRGPIYLVQPQMDAALRHNSNRQQQRWWWWWWWLWDCCCKLAAAYGMLLHATLLVGGFFAFSALELKAGLEERRDEEDGKQE
ncbi:hypothetical protein IWZ01DRAFT_505190 [Phyllosticta capitalensis]